MPFLSHFLGDTYLEHWSKKYIYIIVRKVKTVKKRLLNVYSVKNCPDANSHFKGLLRNDTKSHFGTRTVYLKIASCSFCLLFASSGKDLNLG